MNDEIVDLQTRVAFQDGLLEDLESGRDQSAATD